MSVTASELVRFYPFPGFENPSLPAGMWAGVVVVTGDASGGNRVVDLVFSPIGQAISSRMYSLEQIAVTDEDNNDADISLQSIALGKAGDITFDSLQMGLRLLAGQDQSRLGANDLQALKGWYLGRQNRNSAAASLRMTTPNADTDNLIFQAEGYWWDVRTLNVLGGPSRPAQGMYK